MLLVSIVRLLEGIVLLGSTGERCAQKEKLRGRVRTHEEEERSG